MGWCPFWLRLGHTSLKRNTSPFGNWRVNKYYMPGICDVFHICNEWIFTPHLCLNALEIKYIIIVDVGRLIIVVQNFYMKDEGLKASFLHNKYLIDGKTYQCSDTMILLKSKRGYIFIKFHSFYQHKLLHLFKKREET